MVNKYITDLVSGNNRIIIPDFGAFMIQETPEGKIISFNDFLKFNDGLLVNHIIKNEKVNKNQALDQIKDYVKQIEIVFSQGKAFTIEGLGELSKDAQGNIKFSSKGSSPVEPKKIITEQPIQLLDEKPVEAPIVEPVKSEPELKKEETKAATPTIEPPKPKAEKETTVVPPKAEPAKAVTPPTVKPTTSTKIPTTGAAKQPIVIKTKKKHSVLNTILLLVACLVIIAAGVWAVLTYHVIDRFMPAKEAIVVKTDTIEMVVVDTAPIVDTALNIAEPQPKVIEEQVDPNAKRAYLIAGSFKVKANANKFQNKLTSKGFKSEIIERKNGFNAVSIKDFATKEEALAEWRNLKDEYPGTWILIK